MALAVEEIEEDEVEEEYEVQGDIGHEIRDYLQRIGKTPLLTAQEELDTAYVIERGLQEEAYARLYAQDGCLSIPPSQATIAAGKAAQHRMTEANLRLVISIAKKYRANSGIPLLDLVQEGNIGLMHAVVKYDPHKLNPKSGTPYRFSTYATWWIRQACGRCLYDVGRMIKLPIYVADQIRKLRHLERQLHMELGREPTPQELAHVAGITPEHVLQLFDWAEDACSLDVSISDHDENYTAAELLEAPENTAATATSHQLREHIEQALALLDTREQEVIRLRFGLTENGHAHTLEEVRMQVKKRGEETGSPTRERIRQIETRALRRLRERGAYLLRAWAQ